MTIKKNPTTEKQYRQSRTHNLILSALKTKEILFEFWQSANYVRPLFINDQAIENEESFSVPQYLDLWCGRII